MKAFTPQQIAQHAVSDAFQRASHLSDKLRDAERRLGTNINRNNRQPHPAWQRLINESRMEVIRLKRELAAARREYEELRDEIAPLENAA